jgi:hypothetical protein
MPSNRSTAVHHPHTAALDPAHWYLSRVFTTLRHDNNKRDGTSTGPRRRCAKPSFRPFTVPMPAVRSAIGHIGHPAQARCQSFLTIDDLLFLPVNFASYVPRLHHGLINHEGNRDQHAPIFSSPRVKWVAGNLSHFAM